MPRDLEGLLIVTLEQAVAAPYASCRLADAGARVIKLERAEGDFARRYDSCVKGESAYFVWLNRGKESIRFDLKDPTDQALLRRMLARADVFIQNLAPGAAARAGFASTDLRAEFQRLITCDISGYGEEGPYRDMKAYDLLVQAESGLATVTGTPESPGRVGVSVCDIAAGMYAHQAILQALFARERTGLNRGVQVSLYDSMADWMNVPYLQHHYGGQTPGRPGLNHPTIAPYGAYDCGDGKAVLISIQNEREWRSLCENVLGDANIATLRHQSRARRQPARAGRDHQQGVRRRAARGDHRQAGGREGRLRAPFIAGRSRCPSAEPFRYGRHGRRRGTGPRATADRRRRGRELRPRPGARRARREGAGGVRQLTL